MKGIIDSTLREGEQTVGVSFSFEQKLKIIRCLCDIGIEEIELGIASCYDETPAELIKQCRENELSARLALWSRCHTRDIDAAAAAGTDVISLSIPVSDLHIEKKLAKSRAWVLGKVMESIRYARELKIPFISLGLEDATRAEPDFVESVVRAAKEAGASRIRLADTVGIASPSEITELVKRLKKSSGLEIGVHMHNDFGMATANSIAAIDAGADWVDSTIIGLGERAGNARLEEIVGYLSLRRKHRYQVIEVPSLSRFVGIISNRDILPNQPIIGSDIFTCESGLHLQGLLNTPATYEPFPPESVKARRSLLYGSKIGKREIGNCLKGVKGRFSDKDFHSIVCQVKKSTAALGYPLTAEEFSDLVLSFGN